MNKGYQEVDTSGNEGHGQTFAKIAEMLKEIFRRLDELDGGTE